VAGRGSLLKRQHVHAEKGLSGGGGVLPVPGGAFPYSQECGGGALAGWMAVLPAEALRRSGAVVRRADQALSGSRGAVGALYWRGRLYETEDHYPAQAAANYRAIVRTYQHYFYAQMARRGWLAGEHAACASAATGSAAPMTPPLLVESFPSESPHLARARLLANAGLTIYCARDQADPASGSWSALAEAADLCVVRGDVSRHAGDETSLADEAAAPIKAIPLVYWRILFPEPIGRPLKRSRRRTIWTLTWWRR